MAINQQAENLINTTVNAFNGDVASVSPMDGMSLIDSWLVVLRDDEQTSSSVTGLLSDLKTELQSGTPDGSRVQDILKALVDQTKQIANSTETDVKTKLTSLVEALEGFTQQVGGTSERADTSADEAPISSTVGGESTTSGAGASAQASDDTSRMDGGAYDDDYSPESGTHSSGVDSPGKPLPNHSGTEELLDTDTGTSSGRSQY